MTLLRIALKFSLWMQGLVGNYSLDTNMRAINANVSSSYVLYYGVAFPPRPLGSPSHSSPRRHMWRLSSHSRAWQPHQHTITIILSRPLSPSRPLLSLQWRPAQRAARLETPHAYLQFGGGSSVISASSFWILQHKKAFIYSAVIRRPCAQGCHSSFLTA